MLANDIVIFATTFSQETARGRWVMPTSAAGTDG